MRRSTLAPLLVLCAVAACTFAGGAQASSRIQYGIQDDAWLAYGPGTLEQRLTRFERLGVPLVRYAVHWNEVARRRPRDATSPRDRAYDWRLYDRIVLNARICRDPLLPTCLRAFTR